MKKSALKGQRSALTPPENAVPLRSSFSIRNLLQGELQEFVRTSGFECLATLDFVRDITCLLAAYREEDVPLFPEVFLFPSLDQITAVSPGTRRLTISRAPLRGKVAERILKDCAPLAINGWSVYLARLDARTPPTVEYGLFRSLLHSFATSAEESMSQVGPQEPILLLRNRGHLVVELLNASLQTLTISFTSAQAADSRFANDVHTFVVAATSNMEPNDAAQFAPYLTRLLIHSLQHCHGTLLAAYNSAATRTSLEQLGKGVWLETPIELANAHRQATQAKDADSLAVLQSLEIIVSGMINSDGVVVFGTDGSVLGYRIFLSPSDQEKQAQEQEGGGRRRTFSLMRMRLGADLQAAFFRSQDGATACERNNI